MESTEEGVARPRLEDRWCSGISPPSSLLPPIHVSVATKRRLILKRGGQVGHFGNNLRGAEETLSFAPRIKRFSALLREDKVERPFDCDQN